MTEEEETAFEREYGVPVNAGGSVVVATWGTALVILFAAIAFSALLLSYFYLRLENPAWPPPGIAGPGFAWALAAAALVVASGGAVRAAQRRVRAGDQAGFVRALVVALALAAAGVAVQWVDLARLDFGWTDHAYGSIFYTLAGFVLVVAGGSMVMLAMAVYWALRGEYTARRHAPIANMARFWTAMVVVWLIGFATLYLGPPLT
jgi:cytochrome c oxidase subunit I+III